MTFTELDAIHLWSMHFSLRQASAAKGTMRICAPANAPETAQHCLAVDGVPPPHLVSAHLLDNTKSVSPKRGKPNRVLAAFGTAIRGPSRVSLRSSEFL